MPLGDSLAWCHHDLVSLYKNAESLCTGGPWKPDNHSHLEEVTIDLCTQHDELREAGVEEVLGYFTYAYAQSCSVLLEGKFLSYHHAIFSLASDVVADIRARLKARPTDWTGMVEDLNRRAIEFEQFAKVGDGILVQLDHELVVAINLQSPGFQQAPTVASAPLSEALAGDAESATPMATSAGLSPTIPPVAMGADAAVPIELPIARSSDVNRQLPIPLDSQTAVSGGEQSETIPPEFRTRTMSKTEAARKLGYKGTNPVQHVNRLIEKGPANGGIHQPIGSGQQWVFHIEDFPVAVRESLRPKNV